jgi:TonB family protein
MDDYRTRFLLCLALSLAVVAAVVHLPAGDWTPRIGWRAGQQYDPITISDLQEQSAPDPAPERASQAQTASAPLPTQHERAQRAVEATSETADSDGSDPQSTSRSTARDRTIARMATLDPSNQPELIGGRGALYMHIMYPIEALRKHIQGRVLLEFVVTEEGEPTKIRVAQSVHPLCDSAAVRALRSVRFAPARQNGRPVPVLMKLPVRFHIPNAPSPDSTHTAEAKRKG